MTASVWVNPGDGVDVGYCVEVGGGSDYVSVPDGRCGLAWSRGELWWLGPTTTPWRARAVGRVVGVRLALDSGRLFAGGPLRQWRDRRVPLSTVVDDQTLPTWVDALAGADEKGTIGLLCDLASQRVRTAGGPELSTTLLAQRIGDGEPVSALAHSLSVSPRHLLRHCNDVFGMPPSTLRKILRLHRVARHRVASAHGGWAAAAATEGYADESHLARDARDLTLTTLRVASSYPVRFVQDPVRAGT